MIYVMGIQAWYAQNNSANRWTNACQYLINTCYQVKSHSMCWVEPIIHAVIERPINTPASCLNGTLY